MASIVFFAKQHLFNVAAMVIQQTIRNFLQMKKAQNIVRNFLKTAVARSRFFETSVQCCNHSKSLSRLLQTGVCLEKKLAKIPSKHTTNCPEIRAGGTNYLSHHQ